MTLNEPKDFDGLPLDAENAINFIETLISAARVLENADKGVMLSAQINEYVHDYVSAVKNQHKGDKEMSIHETNIAIERATSLVNILIERNDKTKESDIDNTLFDINRNLCDATKYLNEPVEKQEQHTDTTAEINIDLADVVDAAMLNINKICIVGS